MSNIVPVKFESEEPIQEKEPDPARVKFHEYVSDIMKMYLDGYIDVVVLGFSDSAGVPYAEYGPAENVEPNDIMALGREVAHEGDHICREGHLRLKQSL